jgi:hypothetical protein
VIRRVEIRRLLATRYIAGRRGTVRGIARELGVDPGTICRDIKAILREMKPCSQCGKLATPACCGGADVPPVDVSRPPGGWTARGPRPRSDPAEAELGEAGIVTIDWSLPEGVEAGNDHNETDAAPRRGTEEPALEAAATPR